MNVERAAAELRRLAHEHAFGAEPMPTVKRRRSPSARAHELQQLVLVADRAVGEEEHLAREAAARVGRERRDERRLHLGAAVRP